METSRRRQIFYKVKTHLLKQMKRSMLDTGTSTTCAYRGEDGLKCAVGCLMTDSTYSSAIEKQSVRSIIVEQALSDSGVIGPVRVTYGNNGAKHIYSSSEDEKIMFMLNDLQRMHDNDAPIAWRQKLEEYEKTLFKDEEE